MANEPSQQQSVDVIEFAARRCAVACMQTPAVVAALETIASRYPAIRPHLSQFWHALQLRRPEARRRDAIKALAAIKDQLNDRYTAA